MLLKEAVNIEKIKKRAERIYSDAEKAWDSHYRRKNNFVKNWEAMWNKLSDDDINELKKYFSDQLLTGDGDRLWLDLGA